MKKTMTPKLFVASQCDKCEALERKIVNYKYEKFTVNTETDIFEAVLQYLTPSEITIMLSQGNADFELPVLLCDDGLIMGVINIKNWFIKQDEKQ